jgi:hypothetical protein
MCCLTFNKNDDLPYHHHYILNNLVAIDHFMGRCLIIYVLEAHIELYPFDSPDDVLLWSIARHAFMSLTLDGFAMSVTLLVSSPLLILGPSISLSKCDWS